MMDPFFKEMVEVVKEIAPAWHTWDMHTIMQRLHEAYQSKKPSCYKIQEETPNDMCVGCIYAHYKVNPNIFQFYFDFMDIFHHPPMHPLFRNIYEFYLIF